MLLKFKILISNGSYFISLWVGLTQNYGSETGAWLTETIAQEPLIFSLVSLP